MAHLLSPLRPRWAVADMAGGVHGRNRFAGKRPDYKRLAEEHPALRPQYGSGPLLGTRRARLGGREAPVATRCHGRGC